MANLPETAEDIFDKFLPLGLLAYPDRIREINAIFNFKIEGTGGGEWVLDCISAPPKIYRVTSQVHAPVQASCAIELDSEDFKKIMSDQNYGIDLYFANKLRITGNTQEVIKLGLFFEITRPNPGPEQIK